MDLTAITASTLNGDALTFAVVVITALAGMWGVRKLIAMTNKS